MFCFVYNTILWFYYFVVVFWFGLLLLLRWESHHITSHFSTYIYNIYISHIYITHLDVDTFWTFVPYFKQINDGLLELTIVVRLSAWLGGAIYSFLLTVSHYYNTNVCMYLSLPPFYVYLPLFWFAFFVFVFTNFIHLTIKHCFLLEINVLVYYLHFFSKNIAVLSHFTVTEEARFHHSSLFFFLLL